MASKRKSSTPCMIPVKTMHMRDEVEQDLSCSTRDRDRDSAYPSREGVYGLGYQDLGESSSSSRHDSQGASSPKDGGTYTCRPCNFETLDLNLFLDHVYSGHPEFRSDPSFHCVDCGVTSAKFEGLALHNARVHPSTVTTTLQLRKKDRKVTVEQSLVPGPGDILVSKDTEISITKTPIMRMLKGKSEKRIVVSHSMADDSRLEAMSSTSSTKACPTVTVTHVPTIVHNGSTNKVTIPSAIQIVNGSGALPIIKTAVTQVVSVVQNRGHNQHHHSSPTSVSPSSVSATSSSGSSKNLPKVMIPLSSIPTYNASMDSSSFLKTSFSKFPYPTKAELCYLTVVTKYPEEQIKIWFTAQRLKQGISWSPEEIEEARRKMFNTIIQTAPSSGHQTQHQQSARQQTHHHSAAQQTITVLPASLGASGIPHILQGSLVSQGGVIVTQPMMANGIQVNSTPVALAVTPKPQSAAKPMMQARPAAALVADKGVSMVVGTVGSSSSLNYTFSSSSSGSNSSNSILSSSSSSSCLSSNIASSSLSILSSVINAAGAIGSTTFSSAASGGKTIIGNNRNASSPLSLTTKTYNANKSTENSKSPANGNKNAAPSPPIAKNIQDATKAGSNGKESSSNSSTVKNTKDGKASPDIKISTDSNSSTDVKMDIKTESNGPSPIPTPSPSTTPNANTSTTSTSDTAATTTSSTAVTASNNSGVAGGGSNKKGDATAKAAAASSPSTSGSRSVSSPSLLDPNNKQNKKSQEQLLALKDSFLVNQFPNQEEINRLTSMTGLTVREVRKWFSDRRYHFRNLKGPRTSTGGDKAGVDKAGGDKAAASGDKKASPDTTTTTAAASTAGTSSGAGTSSSEAPAPAPAPAPERPKTPTPTPMSPPQQEKQTTSPTTPSRRPPRPPSPDFTAIRYKEREPHQLVALEASFSVDPDPSSEEVDKLRQETKMTRREIHGWFAERRKRAAVEKKKEEAERAEKEDMEAAAAAAASMEVGGGTERKEEGEEKMMVDEPPGDTSATHQQGKDEKQKEDAPKVNPIKINLKMLKVTESNGKEGEPSQADPPKLVPATTSSPPPIPASSTPYRGKKTPDQLHVLKQAFARTQWPGSPQYDELMAVTGLPRPEVVRWFGDCRYVLKNGQLKWLESYQSMVEEEDFHKANLEVLKEHLEANGKLDEAQVKELAKGSGLTEDLVRRWFTSRAPLLLAAKKAEEEGEKTEAGGEKTEAASVADSTEVPETTTTKEEEVSGEKEPKEKEKEKEKEQEKEKDKGKEKEEEEAAQTEQAQQDQGSKSEERSEEKSEEQQLSPSGDSAKTKAADSKPTSPDQGAD